MEISQDLSERSAAVFAFCRAEFASQSAYQESFGEAALPGSAILDIAEQSCNMLGAPSPAEDQILRLLRHCSNGNMKANPEVSAPSLTLAQFDNFFLILLQKVEKLQKCPDVDVGNEFEVDKSSEESTWMADMHACKSRLQCCDHTVGRTLPRALFCVRHGRSVAQESDSKQRKTDEKLCDAALSREGQFQAAGLRALLPEQLGLVVCSPLTRALQTALTAVGAEEVPIIVHPALREIGGIPENRPRKLGELGRDSHLTRLPGFSRVNWDALGNGWPADLPPKHDGAAQLKEREEFISWLSNRPEPGCVVLVGHYNVFRGLLPWAEGIVNCSPISCTLHEDHTIRAPQ